MKFIVIVSFLLIIARGSFGATMESKCGTPSNGNRPYTGEEAFGAIFTCMFDPDKEETQCLLDDAKLDECKLNISAKLQPCTDSTSAYIPEFATKVFESVHRYLCEGDDQSNLDDLKDFMSDSKCTDSILVPFENCHRLEPIKDIHVAKDVFCKRARDLVDCVGDPIRTHCSERQYKSFSDTAEALLAPCSD